MATYVSIDIETTGPSTRAHRVVSVGFYIGDSNGNRIDSKRFNSAVVWPAKPDYYGDFDMQCWDEFWSKLPPTVIGECIVDSYDPMSFWELINSYLNEIEEKYQNITFVCDNPSFDIAFMDHYLFALRGKPMRYSVKGEYRSIKVSDDMFSMLPKLVQQEANERIAKLVTHDHNPVNDAHYNYLQLIEALKWKEQQE